MRLLKYSLLFLMLTNVVLAKTYAGEIAYPPDIQRIRDRGKLIVAMYSVDTPPLFMVDKKGELTGYDVEMATAIAKRLGVELEFNRTPDTFDEVVNTVARHDADLAVSMISRTLKRSEIVRFSDPYLILKPVLLVNRLDMPEGGSNNEIIRILRGRKVIVGEQEATSYMGMARDFFPKGIIKGYPLWADVVNALLKREVNTYLRDEVGVWNLSLKSPEVFLHLKLIELDSPRDSISIVLPYDSTHLLEWINIFISDFYPPGPVDELLKRYSYLYEKEKGSKK